MPARVEQELHWLRQGLALGWVPPRPVLERVLAQIDAQLAPAGLDSPFLEPLQRLGPGIPAAEMAALRAQGMRLLAEPVRPAWQKLRDFVAGPYLAAAGFIAMVWGEPLLDAMPFLRVFPPAG